MHLLAIKDAALTEICSYLDVKEVTYLASTCSCLRIASAGEWDRRDNDMPTAFKSQARTARKRVERAFQAHKLATAPHGAPRKELRDDPFTNNHQYEYYCRLATKDALIWEGFVPYGPTNWDLLEVPRRYGVLLPPDPKCDDGRAVPVLRVNLTEILKHWEIIHSHMLTKAYLNNWSKISDPFFNASVVAMDKSSVHKARLLRRWHGIFGGRSEWFPTVGGDGFRQVNFTTGTRAEISAFPRNNEIVEYVWEIKSPGLVEAPPRFEREAVEDEEGDVLG